MLQAGGSRGENGIGSASLWKAATPDKLPSDAVFPILSAHLLDRQVVAALTGPDKGYKLAREWKAISKESTNPEKKKLLKINSKAMLCGNHGEQNLSFAFPSSYLVSNLHVVL